MTVPTLDSETFGLALATPYGQSRASSFYVLRTLKGRARYRRRDSLPSYLFEINYDWSEDQFGAFQQFWQSRGNGSEAFLATLVMAEENPAGFVITDTVTCQPTGSYSASSGSWGRWRVSITVEVPAGTSLTGTACDVIYGGPIILPATDVIYAGEPDNLPTDVINPCPAIAPPPIKDAA